MQDLRCQCLFIRVTTALSNLQCAAQQYPGFFKMTGPVFHPPCTSEGRVVRCLSVAGANCGENEEEQQ